MELESWLPSLQQASSFLHPKTDKPDPRNLAILLWDMFSYYPLIYAWVLSASRAVIILEVQAVGAWT